MLDFHRFGDPAIRLGKVLSVEHLPSQDDQPSTLRVHFRDSLAVTLQGDEAAAMLAYMETLAPPTPGPKAADTWPTPDVLDGVDYNNWLRPEAGPEIEILAGEL